MGVLVLIRHGESLWNKKNVFTGWVDVPLSTQGIEEALEAGEVLANIEFDKVYTSVQIRAIQTALTALAKSNSPKVPVIIHTDGLMAERTGIYNQETRNDTIPVYTDWHLNERYYGELQGLNKGETRKQYGDEQVLLWRRSYAVRPPGGESLKDTAERTIPFFKNTVMKELEKGKNIFLSAHGNSLRSIVMYIETLSEEEVLKLEIETGEPLIYNYLNGKLSRK